MYIDDKGYWRMSDGTRLHRHIAELLIVGRRLKKDEVVHHKDGDKLNPLPWNLEVMTEREHNSITAKQYWFLKKFVWPKEKEAWDLECS